MGALLDGPFAHEAAASYRGTSGNLAEVRLRMLPTLKTRQSHGTARPT